MSNAFYTIGHSTRPLAEFVSLLQNAAVNLVVDVRTVPRSRTHPQYNHDVLPQSLAPITIGYEHIAALGGLRGKDRSVPPSVNGFWQNGSASWGTPNAAPSCARKRYGGGVIGGSSPTICWRRAKRCSTPWDQGSLSRHA